MNTDLLNLTFSSKHNDLQFTNYTAAHHVLKRQFRRNTGIAARTHTNNGPKIAILDARQYNFQR
jgi:hypothetical protein